MHGNVKDLTKQRFGRLTALWPTPERRNGGVVWFCKCDCGNQSLVSARHLKRGGSKSCGCLQKELISQKNKVKIKHGDARTDLVIRLYRTWSDMKNRCSNPKNADFKRYGGRGIKVCPEWLDYISFRSWALSHGYKSGLTIDRIDNDKEYCPENCQWITNSENSRKDKITGKRLKEAKAGAECGQVGSVS